MEGVERERGRKEGRKGARKGQGVRRERGTKNGQEGEEKKNVKMKKQEEGRKERPKTQSEIRRSLRRADELISSCLFKLSLIIWRAQLVNVGVWVCV